MSNKVKAAIVGASGYAGGELLRILLQHPEVEVTQVTSRKYNRFPVTITHPNLRSFTNLRYTAFEDLKEADLIFLALPNGESQKYIKKMMALSDKIIDLGADFRIKDHDEYKIWYGDHLEPKLLAEFVYGIAELHRDEIRTAKYIACGGCEATCSILTLYPLFKNKLIEVDRTIIDAKIGSSAAGAAPSISGHHPERAGVVRSYKLSMHRHTAEVEQELGSFAKDTKVHISATAIEMVRGILVTCQVFLKENLSEVELYKVYKDAYKAEPFIRVLQEKMGIYRFPEPKLLAGTNFCDIALEKDLRSNRVIVVGAIDNLAKGTAGQAVQAMNIMFGWDEKTALMFPGLHPI